MTERIFVAQPIPEPALEVLRAVGDVAVYPHMDRQIAPEELLAGLKSADWLFAMHETKVNGHSLRESRLKGIGVLAKDDPDIDMDAANELRIPVVAEDPAIFAQVSPATADLTVAMLLGLGYRLLDADRYTRSGRFRQEQTMALMGMGVDGKTVGLIGMGKVAEHMVPRLLPFGMNILYTKRTRLDRGREKELGVHWVEQLDELLARSDYVCLACDYNKSTHKLIGRRELGLMKPTSFLINTARGRIVDQPELIDALRERRIAGAGLDVFWDEPPHVDEPFVPEELRKLDNVILAPHNGGATWQVRTNRTVSVAQSMIAVMKGERPPTLLNPGIYAR